MAKKRYGVCEVAKILGVTRQTVHYWCTHGFIEYNEYATGRKWFSIEQIKKFENAKK